MKNICLLALILCLGCDDTFDSLNSFNTSPSISFGENGITLSADVKTSIKTGNGQIPIKIDIADLENQTLKVYYTFTVGTGTILSNGLDAKGVLNSVNNIVFQAKDNGDVVITFRVEDPFGAGQEAVLKLNVFENKVPIANFTWSNLKIDGPYYVEFDASASIDPDAAVGGGIQGYIYTIKKNNTEGEEVISTTKVKLPYNLRGPGGYDVKLEVVDNDGAISQPFRPQISNQVRVD